MTTLTASDLNYMVFRYLQESGFLHTAFTFGHEAAINRETSIDPNSVPPGALFTCVQKGIQYLEMEANLKIDDTKDISEDFAFFKPFDRLNMHVDELKQALEEKRVLKAAEDLQNLSKENERGDREGVVNDKQKGKIHDDVNFNFKESMAFGGPKPLDVSTSSTPRPHGQPRGVRSSDVLVLEGHSDEVYTCAWSPTALVLASGSKDTTARIWSIADRTNSTNVRTRLAGVHVLSHTKPKSKEYRKDVTTLDWNSDGSLLATGAHDGLVRIWHENGEQKHLFIKHKGPIFSLKWNKKGNYLLTGGFDRRTIVWDVKGNKLMQQFEFHSGSVLNVDWRTNLTFASSSTDNMIYVCKIGQNQPVKMFRGHKDEVNCVQWDPSGLLLASCSDDTTAKIWSVNQDMPVHDFKDHAKEVYTLKWSPTGPTTMNPSMQLLLASASCDSTVKLWDVATAGLYCSLNGHRDAVYCVAFSPNGEYLASGSGDKLVNVWSVKDGKIVKTYFCKGSVSQVSWSKDGKKIAYSTLKNSLCVSDFRR